MTHSNTKEVSSPAHYTAGNKEAIEFVEATGELEGFCLGNIIKYLYRYKLKGNPVQDLMKAREYLERLIICVKNKMDEEQRMLNDNEKHNTEYWKEQQRLMQNITVGPGHFHGG